MLTMSYIYDQGTNGILLNETSDTRKQRSLIEYHDYLSPIIHDIQVIRPFEQQAKLLSSSQHAQQQYALQSYDDIYTPTIGNLIDPSSSTSDPSGFPTKQDFPRSVVRYSEAKPSQNANSSLGSNTSSVINPSLQCSDSNSVPSSKIGILIDSSNSTIEDPSDSPTKQDVIRSIVSSSDDNPSQNAISSLGTGSTTSSSVINPYLRRSDSNSVSFSHTIHAPEQHDSIHSSSNDQSPTPTAQTTSNTQPADLRSEGYTNENHHKISEVTPSVPPVSTTDKIGRTTDRYISDQSSICINKTDANLTSAITGTNYILSPPSGDSQIVEEVIKIPKFKKLPTTSHSLTTLATQKTQILSRNSEPTDCVRTHSNIGSGDKFAQTYDYHLNRSSI